MKAHPAFPAILAIGVLMPAILPPVGAAIGIASPFGEVVVKNATVGMEFNLRSYAGIPYRVINTSLTAEPIEILVLNGASSELRKGYDPIPDPSWVRLGKSEFELGPGGEGVTDVFISIPKENRYLGKKYQVTLWARTKAQAGGRLFGTGVQSRLLIQTAYDFKTPEEIKKTSELTASLEFYFKPAEIKLVDFPLGKEIHAKKVFGKSFKIVNFHDQAIKMLLREIDASRSYALLPSGFKVAPSDWLRLERGELNVEPDSIGEINFLIKIPDLPENRGQKYYFIVEGVLQGYEVPLSAYGRVSLETAK
mgnify:CR=1 FL=1